MLSGRNWKSSCVKSFEPGKVGPDWPCMLMTYGLIIVPTIFFIINIAIVIHAGLVVFACFTVTALLIAFSMTACSDPGVIYTKPPVGITVTVTPTTSRGEAIHPSSSNTMGISLITNQDASILPEQQQLQQQLQQLQPSSDIEENRGHDRDPVLAEDGDGLYEGDVPEGVSVTSSNTGLLHTSTNNTNTNVHDNTNTSDNNTNTLVMEIECSLCHMNRPRSAHHCYDCGVCVDELDHHCPWTGKCIGRKTLQSFYIFLWLLALHVLFVLGVFMYAVTSVDTDFDLFINSPKRGRLRGFGKNKKVRLKRFFQSKKDCAWISPSFPFPDRKDQRRYHIPSLSRLFVKSGCFHIKELD
eukprot:gene10461-21825_t